MVRYERLGSSAVIAEETNSPKLVEKLANFMQVERDLRSAKSLEAFGFVVCNSVKKLVQYDSALLLIDDVGRKRTTQKVETVSGVSIFDEEAPLVKLCQQLVNSSEISLQDTDLHTVDQLPDTYAQALSSLQLREIVTVVLYPGRITLIFVRNKTWRIKELQLLQQIAEPARHAVQPLLNIKKRKRLSLSGLYSWNAKYLLVVLLFGLSFIPVSQSVIATGEIRAKSPVIVASGLNGVVKDVLVEPNEEVIVGQILVIYDDTELILQRDTLREELKLAQERLRKATQRNLNSARNDPNNRFANLQSQVELKTIDLDYIETMMQRLVIRAKTSGVVLFSRVEDWVGRSVSTGEKIMEVADPSDKQFEIWVAANDAIELPNGGSVKFFPDAFPLRSLEGSIESSSFFTTQTTTDTLAYRVIGTPHDDDERMRLGMKGTFRLYGNKVTLAYYLFRKPLSAIRRSIGV